MEENKWKNKNFYEALKCSISGIKSAFKTEKNLQIQFVCALIACLFGIVLKISAIEWAILVIVIGIVIFAELMNTVIEKVLDLYSKKYDEDIKIAKDVSGGAVLVVAIVSVVIGIIIFLPKILNL